MQTDLSRTLNNHLCSKRAQISEPIPSLAGISFQKMEKRSNFPAFVKDLLHVIIELGRDVIIPYHDNMNQEATSQERIALNSFIDEYAPIHVRPRVPGLDTGLDVFCAFAPRLYFLTKKYTTELWSLCPISNSSTLKLMDKWLHLTVQYGSESDMADLNKAMKMCICDLCQRLELEALNPAESVSQLTDSLRRYHIDDDKNSGTAPQVLSYDEAITYNGDVYERAWFSLAYELAVERLESLGSWNSASGIPTSSVGAEQLIELDFSFETLPSGEKYCRCEWDHRDLETVTIAHNCPYVDFMTYLSLAFEKGWSIQHISTSLSHAPNMYLKALPHLHLFDTAFYFTAAPSFQLFNQICASNALQKGASRIMGSPGKCGVYFQRNSKGVLLMCHPGNAIFIFASQQSLSRRLVEWIEKSSFSSVFQSHQEPKPGVTVHFYEYGMEIKFTHGKSVKFNMEQAITEECLMLEVNQELEKYENIPGPAHHFPDRYIYNRAKVRALPLHERKVRFLKSVCEKCRFDIAYYVNVLTNHTRHPSKDVLSLADWALRYLRTTRKLELTWSNPCTQTLTLASTADASLGTQAHYLSQIGFYYMINGDAICGFSRRTEKELGFINAAEALAVKASLPQLVKIKRLIKDLDIGVESCVFTDSKTVIHHVNNPHNICDSQDNFVENIKSLICQLRDHNLTLDYVCSKKNFADLLTKPLFYYEFKTLLKEHFAPM